MISGIESYDNVQFRKRLQSTGYTSSIFIASEVGSVKSERTIKSAMSEKVIEAAEMLAERGAELAVLKVDRQYTESNEQSKLELMNSKKNVVAAEDHEDKIKQNIQIELENKML